MTIRTVGGSSRIRKTFLGSTLPVLIVVVSACSSIGEAAPSVADSATDQENAAVFAPEATSDSPLLGLVERPGPRHETTGDVPHIQTDASPVEQLDEELHRLVFSLPGVDERESLRSLPGAAGLWLSSSLELARGDVLGESREMAHIHPDGSLHVFLPVDVAMEVDRTKWGELHPWVDRPGFWDGVTMVYTPETAEEVDVALAIVVASYNFIVGTNIDPADVG